MCGKSPVASLRLDGFALAPDLGNHGPHDLYLDALSDFELDFRFVTNFGNLNDDSTGKHNLIASPDILYHLLMCLGPLLLRANDQEIHNHENKNEWHNLDEHF